jgi:undecaprenyl-diphosphatase
MPDILAQAEYSVLLTIQRLMASPAMDSFFLFATRLGDMGIAWGLAGACLLAFRKTRVYGAALLLSLFAYAIVGNFALKALFSRIRPFERFGHPILIPPPLGFSFPSGHTGSSFAAAYCLFRANRKLALPFYFLAGLIAFSRLYLVVHYPTDVLCGALLGTLIARFVCLAALRALDRRNGGQSEPEQGQQKPQKE